MPPIRRGILCRGQKQTSPRFALGRLCMLPSSLFTPEGSFYIFISRNDCGGTVAIKGAIRFLFPQVPSFPRGASLNYSPRSFGGSTVFVLFFPMARRADAQETAVARQRRRLRQTNAGATDAHTGWRTETHKVAISRELLPKCGEKRTEKSIVETSKSGVLP